MALGSIEYKELLNAFGEDVQEINDDLYQATKPATPAKKRESIVKTARKKLQDYDALLTQLEGAQRTNAEKRFADLMTEMRESVTQAEKVR
jgi:small-conductance mechanosensitive channel